MLVMLKRTCTQKKKYKDFLKRDQLLPTIKKEFFKEQKNSKLIVAISANKHESILILTCLLLKSNCLGCLGKLIQHSLEQPFEFCWTMLTAGVAKGLKFQHIVNTWFEKTPPEAWHSVPGSRELGYANEGLISAHAHTRQCWKSVADGFNFIQHSR